MRNAPGPALALASWLLAMALPAQTCASGRLLKNDILPDNPGGAAQIGVVQGLCDTEAAMAVIDTGGPARVTAVSALFAHRFGTNGALAVADVEIYDGVTFQPNGKATLGPLVFKLSSGSSNLQLTSTGINAYTLPAPVRVLSGKAVIGFRMLQNLGGGSCALGFDANFATDVTGACAANAGKNILDAIGHGPVDPSVYTGFGVPLCPLFFRGNWVIRACVTQDVTVTWTGNPTPGGFVSLVHNAPGQGGNAYVGLVSGGIANGFQTPWGRLPLDPDPLFDCFLDSCRAIYLGNMGVINSNGQAFGALAIPNLTILIGSNLKLHVAFVTYTPPNFAPWVSVSAPSLPIVIR